MVTGGRAAKSAILELGVHFVDIACSLAGAVPAHGRGSGGSAAGRRHRQDHRIGTLNVRSPVTFHLGYSGTAQRTRIMLEFERSTVEVGFFPDGCRVMPQRGTPIDDGHVFGGPIRPVRSREAPTPTIPRRTECRRAPPALPASPPVNANAAILAACDLASIAPTMETMYTLSAAVYGGLVRQSRDGRRPFPPDGTTR